jgi:hypothetical protein
MTNKLVTLKETTYNRLKARLGYSDTFFHSGVTKLLDIVDAVELDADDYPSILLRIREKRREPKVTEVAVTA